MTTRAQISAFSECEVVLVGCCQNESDLAMLFEDALGGGAPADAIRKEVVRTGQMSVPDGACVSLSNLATCRNRLRLGSQYCLTTITSKRIFVYFYWHCITYCVKNGSYTALDGFNGDAFNCVPFIRPCNVR